MTEIKQLELIDLCLTSDKIVKDISELEERLEETYKEARREERWKMQEFNWSPRGEGEGALVRGLHLYNPALTSDRM